MTRKGKNAIVRVGHGDPAALQRCGSLSRKGDARCATSSSSLRFSAPQGNCDVSIGSTFSTPFFCVVNEALRALDSIPSLAE
jgi:hypothetical protein